jgi:hypothetical protein
MITLIKFFIVFYMPDAKKVTTPIAPYFKLSSTQYLVTDEDIE